jgi:tetratricopeptide (TPR) repeat protein
MLMEKYFKFIVSFLFCFAINISWSQDGLNKAQLYAMLAKYQPDSVLVDVYNELCWPIYCYENLDSAKNYGQKAIELAKKIKDEKRECIAHRRLGIAYINSGLYKQAIEEQKISLSIAQKIKYTRGEHLALNNIGVAYLDNELYNKALEFLLQALKIRENEKDHKNAANIYINCGIIYGRLANYEKAKQFYYKALQMAKQQNETGAKIVSYTKLSAVCRNLNQNDSATYFLNQAIKLATDSTIDIYLTDIFINKGLVLQEKKQFDSAIVCFKRANFLNTNPNDLVTIYVNIGDVYMKLNKPDSALNYYKLSYITSQKNRFLNNLTYSSIQIAKIYYEKRDLSNYHLYMTKYIKYADTMQKENNIQQAARQQLEFDYERQRAADSIQFVGANNLLKAQVELSDAKLKQERVIMFFMILVILLVVGVAIFTYKRMKLTAKQNGIIEYQKQLVEEKNKEMLDSIQYAERLQSAILPDLNIMKSYFDVSIFYKPKDIIGGDFYFFELKGDDCFFAVCDCTGHGIPGAIMSVVCSNALNKAISTFHLNAPGDILHKTRELVIDDLDALQKNIRDGMDCSLMVWNKKSRVLHWAGANNPLWILQNNELKEIKADKQPIGIYEGTKPFITHKLTLNEPTRIVLFTDGYADQFGGDKGKKIMSKQVKDWLIQNQHISVDKVSAFMQSSFENWKRGHEQVDDVALAIIDL